MSTGWSGVKIMMGKTIETDDWNLQELMGSRSTGGDPAWDL